MNIKKLLALSLVAAMIATPVWAQNVSTGLTLSKELQIGGRGNEYVSGDYPGAVLMKINLWGAVNRSGIHYIPTKTDLVTLLSYAGGPADRAKLDEVVIKRTLGNGKQTVIEVDVEDILEGGGEKSPVLEANDIVVIPASNPLISNDTIALIGVIATVVSVAATGFILQRTLSNK